MKFFWNDPAIGQDPNKIPVISKRMLVWLHVILIAFIAIIHWMAVSFHDF